MGSTNAVAKRSVVLAACLALAVGCADPASESGGAPTTAPSTTGAVSTTTLVATTPATTTTTTTPLLREDGTPLALPEMGPGAPPGLLKASDVPWDQVGPGWVLAVTGTWDEPAALVLLDPADAAYGLGGWDVTWRLLDWEGSRILVARSDDLAVLDLTTGSLDPGFSTAAYQDVYWLSATLVGDGNVLVGTMGLTGPDEIHLEILTLGGDSVAVLFHRDYDPAGPSASWARHPGSGIIATADDDRLTLVDGDGAFIGETPLPGLSCRVPRWWTEDSVLVSCIDPVYAASAAAECWPGSGRRLWEVPIDGTDPTPLSPPVESGAEGCDGYEPEYLDALDTGTLLVAETGGCCECGGDLVGIRPDRTVLDADNETLAALECSPGLLTLRNGAAIVTALVSTEDIWVDGLFEVTPTPEHRRLLGGAGVLWVRAYPSYGGFAAP